MKILFDPIPTNPDIRRCSTNQKMMAVMRRMLEQDPDCWAYYAVPECRGSFFTSAAEFASISDRIQVVPFPYHKDRFKEYYRLSDTWLDLFSYNGRYWDYDAVITSRIPAMAMMRFYVNQAAYMGAKVLVGMDSFPLARFKKTVCVSPVMETFALYGYYAADLVVSHARWEREGMLDVARRDFAPHVAAEIERKLVLGTTIKKEAIAFKPEGPCQQVAFVGRLQTQKRYEDVFKAFDACYLEGCRLPFHVYTVSQSTAPRKGREYLTFGSLPRDEYHKTLASKVSIVVSWSLEEGMPVGITEALHRGVLVIAPAMPWAVDLLGEDYPFICPSYAKLPQFIMEVAANYPKHYRVFREYMERYWLRDPLPSVEEVMGERVPSLVRALWERENARIEERKHGWRQSLGDMFRLNAVGGQVDVNALDRMLIESHKTAQDATFESPGLLWKERSLSSMRRALMLEHGCGDTASIGVLTVPNPAGKPRNAKGGRA